MEEKIQEVMTSDPITLPATTTVVEAARAMCDANIGDVLVLDGNGAMCGIVTDRDIVVRAVAQGLDLTEARLGDICSGDLTTIEPTQPVEEAVRLMREKALRRLPVVDHDQPVGVVSLGDLAIDRDPDSALADISAAPANT